MPELPEVEIARRNLERWFDGHRVVSAEAEKTRIFRGADPKRFEGIRGRLESVRRKGKYLMMAFEGDQGLVAHLGMTGKWVRRPKGHPEPYSRARFVLDDGDVIHYRDPRLFGRMEPCDASALTDVPAVAALGPDALDEMPDPKALQAALGKLSAPIKIVLMDQARIAGLGNIHAAEALFRARLHPGRKAKSLKPEEWKRLAKGIRDAVRFALERQEGEEIQYVEEGGTENPFLIYGRAGEKCSRCGTKVQSFAQGGRTTFFCPKCQPRSAR
jgi:formamidopyrimidine-DNA glycosylase